MISKQIRTYVWLTVSTIMESRMTQKLWKREQEAGICIKSFLKKPTEQRWTHITSRIYQCLFPNFLQTHLHGLADNNLPAIGAIFLYRQSVLDKFSLTGLLFCTAAMIAERPGLTVSLFLLFWEIEKKQTILKYEEFLFFLKKYLCTFSWNISMVFSQSNIKSQDAFPSISVSMMPISQKCFVSGRLQHTKFNRNRNQSVSY